MKISLVASHLLGAGAAVGAIFADGNISELRIVLAIITISALGSSAIVVYMESKDADRLRRYVETILSSVNAPYFVIENTSNIIKSVCKKKNLNLVKQENFAIGTYYNFDDTNGFSVGRLFISEDEFKSMWLFDEKTRKKYINARMLSDKVFEAGDTNSGYMIKSRCDLMTDFLRACSLRLVPEANMFSKEIKPDGAWSFRIVSNDDALIVFDLSKEEIDKLHETAPLERYAEIENKLSRKISQALQSRNYT